MLKKEAEKRKAYNTKLFGDQKDYPDNVKIKHPKNFNFKLVQEVKDHGIKYKATTYFAGVGFANAKDYDLPLTQSDKYAVNFDGLQIME